MKFVKWDQANDLQCKYDNGSSTFSFYDNGI